MTIITCSVLRCLVHYNKSTGEFTRKDIIGERVGFVDAQGYTIISLLGKDYKAHRLAWLYVTGEWPKDQIDHINHKRSYNVWSNLREVTNSDNHKNLSLRKDNKSGVCGVKPNANGTKFYARLDVKGRCVLDRLCSTFDEAVKARKEAEIEYGFHKNHGK